MKRRLSSLFVSLAVVMGGLFAIAIPAHTAFAQVDVFKDACSGGGGTTGGTGTGAGAGVGAGGSGGSSSTICGAATGGKELPDLMKTIINTMIFIVGTVAVVMIVIGGVKYVVSNGEASQVQSAKNTVLYSVIGLIIAISAFAIVNFVLDKFK